MTSKLWGAAMSWTVSESTPAAFMTYLAWMSPLSVWAVQKPSPLESPVTAVLSLSSAPFFTAVSAKARHISQGETMAAEGAQSAALTVPASSGSRLLASSPDIISSPSTPFFTPLP